MRHTTRSPNCLLSAFVMLALLLFTTEGAVGQTHLWSHGIGDSEADGSEAVIADHSGNVFVTGSFRGTADFGGGTLTSAGGFDIFLVKYDPSGTHVWSKRFGGRDGDTGWSVNVDESGNVLITGISQGGIDFGGGLLPRKGGSDAVLAKFTSNGVHLWSQQFGSSTNDGGYSVCADVSGNVLVTGVFTGFVDLGGDTLISSGQTDAFIVKYDADGTRVWSHGFGGAWPDGARSIRVDGSGNVLTSGHFQGTADFGGGPLVSAGNSDIYLAKYDSSGTHLWSHGFGGTDSDAGESVSVDGLGNVFIAGSFLETVDFGGGALTSAGSYDIFLGKFDASGTHMWSQRFGGTGPDFGFSTSVDGSGNVFITGHFVDTVDFGGGSVTSAGGSDIVLAKYDAMGTHLWSEPYGGISSETGHSVAVAGAGEVVISGVYFGTVDFGGGPLTNQGSADIFVAEFSEPNVAVAINYFDARATSDRITIRASFASNLEILGVNVYRAEATGPLVLHDTAVHSVDNFYYEDRGVSPGRTYRYQIGVIDDDGEFFSRIVTVTTKPYATSLLPNSPNPFNPTTTIPFTLERSEHVAISIFNVKGQMVTTLLDDVRSAGLHSVRWDGTNSTGSPAGSGVYFCQMAVGAMRLSRQMVLLK